MLFYNLFILYNLIVCIDIRIFTAFKKLLSSFVGAGFGQRYRPLWLFDELYQHGNLFVDRVSYLPL